MSAKQQAAVHLRQAATLMLKGGYIAGSRENTRGAHCALGALDRIITNRLYGSDYNNLAYTRLAQVVRPLIPKGTIDHYNTSLPIEERDSNISSVIACWSNVVALSKKGVAKCMMATAEILELEAEEEESKCSKPSSS